MSTLLQAISSDLNLEAANSWLCQARQAYSPHSDIWNLRRHWQHIKANLQNNLLNGTFHFSPMQQYRFPDRYLTLWCSLDVLVLRAMTQVLSEWICPMLTAVYHVKGKRGIGGALRSVQENLSAHTFVLKTDIKQYYESISHECLLKQLAVFIKDPLVLTLLKDALMRSETYGGLYWEVNVGIPMGSPLSPLLGAVALHAWDQARSNVVFFMPVLWMI